MGRNSRTCAPTCGLKDGIFGGGLNVANWRADDMQEVIRGVDDISQQRKQINRSSPGKGRGQQPECRKVTEGDGEWFQWMVKEMFRGRVRYRPKWYQMSDLPRKEKEGVQWVERSRGDREAHQRFKIQHFLKESVDKMGINTFLHSVDALSSLSLSPRAG